MNLSEASSCLGVNENLLDAFSVVDDFNNNNELVGFLCRHSSKLYGSLLIYQVNGEPVEPQLIYATPKLHYPFGRVETEKRNYHFPKYSQVDIYEKLDGTNICSYSYADAQGERYVTFKTRLTPILKSSRFGNFNSLWREFLADDRYPSLRCPDCVLSGAYSLSYEMYGYRNPLLVAYDVPLEVRLLFGVSQSTGNVVLPGKFAEVGFLALPEIFSGCPDDVVQTYEQFRDRAQEINQKVEDKVKGIEGYVFYLTEDTGNISQWKNKPEMVENEHWSSDFLPTSVITPTVWNALEGLDSLEDLTIEYVSRMLVEEFTVTQINNSYNRIEKVIQEVRDRVKFRQKVMQIFLNTGLTKEYGKVEILRALSSSFDRKQMKDVYNALREMNIL